MRKIEEYYIIQKVDLLNSYIIIERETKNAIETVSSEEDAKKRVEELHQEKGYPPPVYKTKNQNMTRFAKGSPEAKERAKLMLEARRKKKMEN